MARRTETLFGLLLFAVLGLESLSAQDGTRSTPAPLPEGNAGIAAKYPGDWGIERDPAVVFSDGFEGGLGRWNRGSWNGVKVTNDPAHVRSGKTAMEITLTPPSAGKASGMGIGQHFPEGFETLFVRYYVNYEKSMDMLGHNHACCNIAGSTTPLTTAGIADDGRNQFMCCLEPSRGDQNYRVPGEMNMYCYHMDQRSQYGDHFFSNGGVWPRVDPPPAKPFGDTFVSRPVYVPDRERWICCELMVKMNTPGKRDGRIAYWFDGRLSADYPNLRFRAIPELKINDVSFGVYTTNSAGAVCTMWYDDVVAATSYIGPVLKRKKSGPVKSAEEMTKAREAFEKGDLAGAWRHLDCVDSDEFFREAQDKIRKIEAAIDTRLREVQALESIGEKADAIEAYREILREFAGIPAADRAKARIEALRAPPPKGKH
jgi:hypothetical protein